MPEAAFLVLQHTFGDCRQRRLRCRENSPCDPEFVNSLPGLRRALALSPRRLTSKAILMEALRSL